jgi:hypothetical protein
MLAPEAFKGQDSWRHTRKLSHPETEIWRTCQRSGTGRLHWADSSADSSISRTRRMSQLKSQKIAGRLNGA